MLELETSDKKTEEKSDESQEIDIGEEIEKQNEGECENSEKPFSTEPDEKHETATIFVCSALRSEMSSTYKEIFHINK